MWINWNSEYTYMQYKRLAQIVQLQMDPEGQLDRTLLGFADKGAKQWKYQLESTYSAENSEHTYMQSKRLPPTPLHMSKLLVNT